MSDEIEYCYLLTIKNSEGSHIYSLREKNKDPEILVFESRDDAERYAMMLEQDDSYVIGDTMIMSVAESTYRDVVDIIRSKGHKHILVKNDELFIPPTTD